MHSFKKGDEIHVINCSMSGTFFIEGAATIVETIEGVAETYEVRWKNTDSSLSYPISDRFVDPSAQSDPAKYVAELNDPQATETQQNTA